MPSSGLSVWRGARGRYREANLLLWSGEVSICGVREVCVFCSQGKGSELEVTLRNISTNVFN